MQARVEYWGQSSSTMLYLTHARFLLRADIFSASAENKDGLQDGTAWHMKIVNRSGFAAGEPPGQTYSSGKWYGIASFSTISGRSRLAWIGNQQQRSSHRDRSGILTQSDLIADK
jgi:hypothetical protein